MGNRLDSCDWRDQNLFTSRDNIVERDFEVDSRIVFHRNKYVLENLLSYAALFDVLCE